MIYTGRKGFISESRRLGTHQNLKIYKFIQIELAIPLGIAFNFFKQQELIIIFTITLYRIVEQKINRDNVMGFLLTGA